MWQMALGAAIMLVGVMFGAAVMYAGLNNERKDEGE